MAIPDTFGQEEEQVIASYSFTDIADGTGVVTFYAFSSTVAGTYNYFLGSSALDSGNVDPTTVNSHNRRFKLTNNNVTFSLSAFNLPRIVRGTAFVTFTLATTDGHGAGTGTINVSILKNSSTLATTTCTNVGNNTVKSYNISLNISETLFKKGDILKLKFDTTDSQIYVMHDPLDRNITGYNDLATNAVPAVTASENPTKCVVFIPFRIDL
jgi:hypothetical protein